MPRIRNLKFSESDIKTIRYCLVLVKLKMIKTGTHHRDGWYSTAPVDENTINRILCIIDGRKVFKFAVEEDTYYNSFTDADNVTINDIYGKSDSVY